MNSKEHPADIEANPVLAAVYDQWDKKWVFEGTVEQCSKYMDTHNEIGYNYSRMLLKKNGKNGG